jgi:hypothetical protein
VTTSNAYWRLFYIYPFPLVVGILSSEIFTRTSRLPVTKRFGLVALTSIALIGAICLSPYSVLNQRSIRVGWPSYKLPVNSLEQAKEITAIAPPGVMLAPQPISGIVVMLDARFPQIRIREVAERTWLNSNGRQNEAELRIAASDYLGGDNDDFLSLQELLTLYNDRIRSIVIKDTSFNNNLDIQHLLLAHKFVNQQAVDGYVVFWK